MRNLCKIGMLLLVAINLIQALVTADLRIALFVGACIALLSAIPIIGAGFKKITLLFLGIGASLLLYTSQPFDVWMGAITSLTNVIAILVIMQLFTIPIEAGNYSAVVQYWLNRSIRRESSLFLFTTVTTHIFASFLLFGTIPVMVSLFGESVKRRVSYFERFMATAISRGYAMVCLWAPGAVNLFLVIQATGVSWIDIFIPGLILAVMGVATSFLLETKINVSSQPLPEDWQSSIDDGSLTVKEAQSKAGHILLVVLSLIALVVILEVNHFGSAAHRIIFAGTIVCLAWMMYFFRQSNLTVAMSNYWHNGILKNVDLTALFLSLGLFAQAFERSGLLLYIQPYMQHYADITGLLSLALVPVLMILLAIVGIHPFVLIVMFGQILTGLKLPIAPVSLALCLALGGSLAYILSPFAGIVLTLAKFLDCKTTDIAFRWNWAFSIIFLLEGVVFAYCWGRFI